MCHGDGLTVGRFGPAEKKSQWMDFQFQLGVKNMPRIYCIEGYQDYQPSDGWEVSSLVRGQLQAVREAGGMDFVHRTCGTVDEVQFRIGREWLRTDDEGNLHRNANGNVQPHDAGSILYISAHGSPAEISLSGGKPAFDEQEQSITINDLSDRLGAGFARRCLVHLSGCNMVQDCEPDIIAFMEHSGAVAVSGYTEEVGWLEAKSPGLACDAILFAEVSWVKGLPNLANNGQRGAERRKQMCEIAARLRDSFPTVGFMLWLQTPDGIRSARLMR